MNSIELSKSYVKRENRSINCQRQHHLNKFTVLEELPISSDNLTQQGIEIWKICALFPLFSILLRTLRGLK